MNVSLFNDTFNTSMCSISGIVSYLGVLSRGLRSLNSCCDYEAINAWLKRHKNGLSLVGIKTIERTSEPWNWWRLGSGIRLREILNNRNNNRFTPYNAIWTRFRIQTEGQSYASENHSRYMSDKWKRSFNFFIESSVHEWIWFQIKLRATLNSINRPQLDKSR